MKKIENAKKDFPLLSKSDGVYLDSGATTQKPTCVLKDIEAYYEKENANPYRGAYALSVRATEVYNNARQTVSEFINAKEACEIIFTKNATESLNLLAYSYGLDNLKKDEEIVISIMEHHSNLVPWQKVSRLTGAKLKYLYTNENFEIEDSEIEEKITTKTKLVSITSVSNVTGTVNDLKKIIKRAHEVGAKVIVDASQSVAHERTDAQDLDADFLVFSAHKMYGPLGIGVLYGKKELLEKMSPFIMGGDMIEYVYEQETTFAELPHKFEAGTQNVGGAVGLASAIKYLENFGMEKIEKYEKDLLSYARAELEKLPFLTLYSPKNSKISSVLSFNINNVHPHDVSSLLDMQKVCLRSGNHCAQPLMRYLGIDSTCRISFGIYNTKEDVDRLVVALKNVYEKFEKYIKEK